MAYSLVITARAVEMIQDAYYWYEEQRSGLGESFLGSIDDKFEKILSGPELYGKVYKDYRQIKIGKFPFVIIYEIIDREIVVIAVFHTHRDPETKY